MWKFVLLFIVLFFIALFTACVEEDFAPSVDDLEILDNLETKKDSENDIKIENDVERPKEIEDDLCNESSLLPMNCCLSGDNGCKFIECAYISKDGKCVLSCGETIIFYSVGIVLNWSDVPSEFNNWGLPIPTPPEGPIPGEPPPNNIPIFCKPW